MFFFGETKIQSGIGNFLISDKDLYHKIKLASDNTHIKIPYASDSCIASNYSSHFAEYILKKYDPLKTIIVFGDSHAINLYNAIAESNYSKKYNIVGIVSGGCSLTCQNRDCEMSSIVEFLSKHRFYKLFYTEAAFRLFRLNSKESDRSIFINASLVPEFDVDLEKVTKIFQSLKQLDSNVVFVYPWPEYFVQVETYYSLNSYNKKLRKDLTDKSNSLTTAFDSVFASYNKKIQCIRTSEFWGEDVVDINGFPKYCDGDHLSTYGEKELSSIIDKSKPGLFHIK